MPVYALGDLVPTIAPDAYIHPDAVVIGDVTVGSESTVWPGAVLRGDSGPITIGERTSIQDGSVVHTTEWAPTQIGSGCVIGHIVHLEGCIIEDDSLVGSGSVVLHRPSCAPAASWAPTPCATAASRCPPAPWRSACRPSSATTPWIWR